VLEEQFVSANWTSFYPDAQEAIPLNAPKPLGNEVLISCFTDADHAGNRITQRSHTGIIISSAIEPPFYGTLRDRIL